MKCPGNGCQIGMVHPPPHDDDSPSKKCKVCGGRGTIPDAEYEALMQDKAFVKNLAEYTPQSYIDFYTIEYLRHREAEVRAGRMPTMKLAEFIQVRRADQGAPPIDPAFVPVTEPVGDFRLSVMECLARCHNGRVYFPLQPETSFECRMCSPYGGKGTMPVATIAEWMSDPAYMAYFNESRGNRTPYDTWRAEAAARAGQMTARRKAQRVEAQSVDAREAKMTAPRHEKRAVASTSTPSPPVGLSTASTIGHECAKSNSHRGDGLIGPAEHLLEP